MNFDLTEAIFYDNKECFYKTFDELFAYALEHRKYFRERSLYDAIDNLSEKGIIEIPAEYCSDPENCTEEEAERYINDFINALSNASLIRLKYPVLSLEDELDEDFTPGDMIALQYTNLELTDENDNDISVGWTYYVDKDDLYTFIWEMCIDETEFARASDPDFDPNNAENWEEFVRWLDEHFDEIYSNYEERILRHYEDKAREDYRKSFRSDYIDWDSMPGGYDTRKDEDLEKYSVTCCICHAPIDGYGNNAAPLADGTCCDKCNIEKVIPMRLEMMKMDESKELNETADKITLEVKFEVYGRYGDGGEIITAKVSGKDLRHALMRMVDKMRLYIKSDDIEENNLTAEEILDSISDSNGDGCDMIYHLKNLTTGEVLIDEPEYWDEQDWDDDMDESITEYFEDETADDYFDDAEVNCAECEYYDDDYDYSEMDARLLADAEVNRLRHLYGVE